VDTVFGAVIAALRDKGVLDHTFVIYTSDHGIGLHRAKQSIYAAGTHVPFIIAGPGIQPNRRISAPVSHLDLVPTLLDALAIPKPPEMHGSSLMPILTGKESTVAGRKTIMAAADDKSFSRAVCDGRYYYIRNLRKIARSTIRLPIPNPRGIDPLLDRGLNTDQYLGGDPWFNRTYESTVSADGSTGRRLLSDLLTGSVPDVELFDLDADPWCVRNLADDPTLAPIKTELAAEMAKWRAMTFDHRPR
jgi:hypothetical protein